MGGTYPYNVLGRVGASTVWHRIVWASPQTSTMKKTVVGGRWAGRTSRAEPRTLEPIQPKQYNTTMCRWYNIE